MSSNSPKDLRVLLRDDRTPHDPWSGFIGILNPSIRFLNTAALRIKKFKIRDSIEEEIQHIHNLLIITASNKEFTHYPLLCDRILRPHKRSPNLIREAYKKQTTQLVDEVMKDGYIYPIQASTLRHIELGLVGKNTPSQYRLFRIYVDDGEPTMRECFNEDDDTYLRRMHSAGDELVVVIFDFFEYHGQSVNQ